IVISARGEAVRRFLIAAHRQGWTNGDFVFFSFEPYKQKEMFGDFTWKKGDDADAAAREAFQALFLLSLYKPSDESYLNFSADVVRRSREDFGYSYAPNEEVSILAAMAHDSVWLYAQALDEILSENGNPIYEQVPGVQVRWPGGRSTPPKDTPDCGFKGELCSHSEKSLNASLALIVCLLAAGTLAIAVLHRKYKLQKRASMMLWKVNPNDVAGEEQRTSSSEPRTPFWNLPVMSDLSSGSSERETTPSEAEGRVMSSGTVLYKDVMCSIRFLRVRSVSLTGELLAELQQCRDLNHPNICGFVGASLEPPHLFLLMEYCSKGSLQCPETVGWFVLQDILRNDSIKLDWTFKYSLMLDIVKGMDYLHCSSLRSHGHLSSSNCVVDSRFVLKVTDFGLSQLRWPAGVPSPQDHWQRLLWRAPELLRTTMPPNGTQKGDVYSFGIIVQEVIYRREVFYIPNCTLKAKDIVERVRAGGCSPLRPHADRADCPEAVESLMRSCWWEKPAERPDFSTLRTLVRRLSPSGGSDNILDNLLSRMEQYASNLEEVVDRRTAQFLEEKKKAESLLTQMLPRSVAIQLIAGKMVEAETYDCVTIYLSDIEGFTAMASTITPMQVVDLLNDLYTSFDKIIDNHDVYKVETIGDAYMVVSGLPIRNGDDHAREIARMSLAVLRAMERFENKHVPNQKLKVRIGLHSALRIHVSNSTKALLDKFRSFQLELRGNIHMKGKGPMTTYWLLGEKP
ncbi:atrial natriuretic peptide receptor 1-like, partial [Scleropages formosus]